jgi:ABC-type phosphate/phosphonate transport system ATPase subunit
MRLPIEKMINEVNMLIKTYESSQKKQNVKIEFPVVERFTAIGCPGSGKTSFKAYIEDQ